MEYLSRRAAADHWRSDGKPKRGFATRDDAAEFCATIRRDDGEKPQVSYQCRVCGWWHNGRARGKRLPGWAGSHAHLWWDSDAERELGSRAYGWLRVENRGSQGMRRRHIAKHARKIEGKRRERRSERRRAISGPPRWSPERSR